MCDSCLAIRWDEFPDLDHPFAPDSSKTEVTIEEISARINHSMELVGLTKKIFAQICGIPRDRIGDHINHRPDLMTEYEVGWLCELTGKSRNYYRFGRLEHPEVDINNGKLFGVKPVDLLPGSIYGPFDITPDRMWLLYTYLDEDNRQLVSELARKLYSSQIEHELLMSAQDQLAECKVELLETQGYEAAEGEFDQLAFWKHELELDRKLRARMEESEKIAHGWLE